MHVIDIVTNTQLTPWHNRAHGHIITKLGVDWGLGIGADFLFGMGRGRGVYQFSNVILG